MSKRFIVGIVAAVTIGIIVLKLYFRKTRRDNDRSIEAKPSSKKPGKVRRSASPEPDDASIPQFIMLLGIPGSGKSTWAKEYVFRCDASFTIVSSDEIRKQVTGSVNDQSRNSEVWDIVLNQCQGLLASGKNIILDATNTQTDRRRQFVKHLPKCRRYLKMFSINKSVAKSRIARDIERGEERAHVPDSVVDVMFRHFQDSVAAVREEGWRIK